MKKAKKIIAVLLTVVLVALIAAAPVSAASKVDPSEGPMQKLESIFYMLLDKLIYVVGKALNTFIPGLDWGDSWQNYDDYQTPADFYQGETAFETEVKSDAVWSAGYSYGSLLEGLDILGGSFYMAGSLQAIEGKKPTAIVDDQGVSVYAISDGVSGTVVQAVIDGYGIARADVLEIRSRLAAFAAENDIISINVSVLHQHSAIDILGLGVPLLPAIIMNPGMSVTGIDKNEFLTGKNKVFMDNLYNVVTSTITEAVNDMEEGTLYYGSADVGDLMYDKRKPVVFDEEIHRFRFDPADESSEEIWICEAGIHCTGADGDKVSADYPYYFKEYIKETTGADVVFVQGAELAITAERENVPETEGNHEVKDYGIELAKRVVAIDNDEKLDPVLNITFREVPITADNQILTLAVRLGIVDSLITKGGTDYTLITELGYMELGNKIGVVLVPGEIAPEILWGGVVSKEESWTNESWDFAPMEETAGVDKLLCFGLNNDQIGYILPDNDVRSLLTENEEISASSTKSGSDITRAFEELIASVK
ncbi:MAG: hypothetical protein E7544_01655 [Ruminococcaceae bacterium]|nr:hypothetical protein [Oscillospiraceae bacterium]